MITVINSNVVTYDYDFENKEGYYVTWGQAPLK